MTGRLPAELSVDHERLDVEHRDLLAGVEAARAALGGAADALRQSVRELEDLFLAHFAYEERLMDGCGYPDRQKHRSAHELFMQDFSRAARELEQFGVTPPVREWVDNGLPAWTAFHIRVNDVPLGRFLLARRSAPEQGSAGDKPRAS